MQKINVFEQDTYWRFNRADDETHYYYLYNKNDRHVGTLGIPNKLVHFIKGEKR